MTAQIIPFQTKRDRLLALARSWYRHFKDDHSKRGSIVDREQIIEEAAVEASVEGRLGWRYWEYRGIATDSALANVWRKSAQGSFETNLLRRRLDDCLHGKWQRMRAVAPRRPRRWKPKQDAPIAQIIPLPIRSTERVREAVAK